MNTRPSIIQPPVAPCAGCLILTTNIKKCKPNHQQTGLPPHPALPIRGKTNKQKLSINLTLYEAYTNGWTNISEVKSLSCVRLFATSWTVAHQPPPSMGFSRQEYWSGLPFPSLGDLPNPGTELKSLALQADALPSEPTGKSGPTLGGQKPKGRKNSTWKPGKRRPQRK